MILAGVLIAAADLAFLITCGTITNDDFWSF